MSLSYVGALLILIVILKVDYHVSFGFFLNKINENFTLY
ncbi:hypothetical protein ABID39_000527 [Bartonella japonica]|uniref:Uncharacterized protein n=1 Tax=Bartonella japonica TaxID=357761 RepID=A0ABV2FMQ7_9HYPH